MNGVHDLGGMHGFGPVERLPNDPPFHAGWEPVARAMQVAARDHRLYTLDEFRFAIESMPPAGYLAASYYERWIAALETVLIKRGLTTAEELQRRTAVFASAPDAAAEAAMTGPRQPLRPVPPPPAPVPPPSAPPRFAVGDRVMTKNLNPRGHTRLPRYARAKPGVIHAFRGYTPFPDTRAAGLGDDPVPVYTVRFLGQDLWGEDSEPNQVVYLECFEPYLEPAPEMDRPI